MTLSSILRSIRQNRCADQRSAASDICYFSSKGLSAEAVAELASAIAYSGDIIVLPEDIGPAADMPSTGGPGSMSTIIGHIFLSMKGFVIPKIAIGGSVAGGIDTFARLPGFRSRLEPHEFIKCLRSVGIAHTEAFSKLCPFDKLLIQARRDSGQMSNRYLAAASLLGKKLAVKGTEAIFDFRVGPTGNIGATEEEANLAAELFVEVSSLLGIRTSIFLTDNSTMPSSALGQRESLEIVYAYLTKDHLSQHDKEHIRMCALLASVDSPFESTIIDIFRSRFTSHIEAQGSSWAAFEWFIKEGANLSSTEILADKSGYYSEPDLNSLKSWVKTMKSSIAPPEHSEVGIRFDAFSGDDVTDGQRLLTIRHPKNAAIPKFLYPRIEKNKTVSNLRILKVFKLE